MELVEEETAEIPSCSAILSDDENGSESSDISDLISDISEHNISGFESYSIVPTHLPKWAKKTLTSVTTTKDLRNSKTLELTIDNYQAMLNIRSLGE